MKKDLRALRIDPDKKGRRSGSSSSWLWVLVAFFVGSLLTFFVFRTLQPGQSAPAVVSSAGDQASVSADSGTTAQPAPDPDEPILIVSGYIVPHHRIEVGSKILGKVSWVGVEKSDRVTKGQLLVKLDDREYRAQLRQAEASVMAAGARLAELEAGSRPEEVERAEAELHRARADLENSERELRRLEKLLETGVISEQLVDDAGTRRDMASAALRVAEKNHRLTVLGPRDEQVDSARAELERAQASVRYWQTQLAETEIRAPITGTVLERIAEVGEMVSTAFAGGAVVVALADLNDLQVELDISQSDFHHIAMDNRCVMSPVAYPKRKYQCRVVEIAPEANRQRATIEVKVQVLDPDSFLRPEMDAQVTLYRGSDDG